MSAQIVKSAETRITTQAAPFLSDEDLRIIKQTIARDANDAEFLYFIKIATLRRLNPLLRQIHLQIFSKDNPNKRSATIITTIHGLRLIADRTGRYLPGRAATYEYDDKGKVVSATAYVMVYHPQSNTWHEVSDTAYVEEFDRRDGQWTTMKRLMTAKCAEALALRRAFPEDLTGLYTDDEMGVQMPAADPQTGEIVDSHAKPQSPTEAELRARWEKAVDKADALGLPLTYRDYPASLTLDKQWGAVEKLEKRNRETEQAATAATTAA